MENFRPLEITAEFIGENGSCGFIKGNIYKLWILTKHGRYYISRRDLKSKAIPYDTMIAIKKNWNIKSW